MGKKSKFDKDLQDGKQAEKLVLALIQRDYPKARIIEGYHPEFDIYVPEVKVRVEVKYDIKSHKTGNYFIETEYKGEPSGITTSGADWWVIMDKENILWIETDVLRYLVKNLEEEPYGDKSGKIVSKSKLLNSPYAFRKQRIMV